MSHDFISADAGRLREVLAAWRALAPLRETSAKIDWQKVIEFLEKILPVMLALLELLPQRPTDSAARP